MKKMDIRMLCLIAVMTALMCVLGPMSIPIGPVPVSLTVLTVYLAVYVLGMRYGSIAYVVYLLLGLVGLPVLSGYTGGPAKLFGATGGYLIGFLPMAVISGYFIDKFYTKIYMQVLGMIGGLVVCYAMGTMWLALMAKMSLAKAFFAGVVPFVLFDLAKIAVAVLVGRAVRSRLSLVLKQEAAIRRSTIRE